MPTSGRTWRIPPTGTSSGRPSPRAGSGDGSRPRQARAGRDHDRHGRVRGPLGKGTYNTAKLLGGPQIDHYHQAIALVVAETFEQARAAAQLVRVDYDRAPGTYDLAKAKAGAAKPERITGGAPDSAVGDFAGAYAAAPVQVDSRFTTPDLAHAMMEPHATIAAWRGDELTVWTVEPDGRLGPKRHGQDPRHRQEQGAADLALHRRRLRRQAVHPRRRAAGSARRTRRASARESRLAACPDGQQHRPSAGDDPACPARRDARRHDHRDRARELVGRSAAGQARRRGAPDPHALRRRQPDDGDSLRRARSSRSQRHARARRSHRAHGARGRDGRARREARHRPGRTAHPQRHAGRSRPRRPGAGEPAVLATPARRVPAPGRRPLRLEQAQPAPGADPRRPLARRHGRGGSVPRRARHQVGRTRSSRQPRHGDGRDRHDRHRHRQLHHHRPDGGRDDGRAAQRRRRSPRRLELPGLRRLGRAMGRGELDRGRLRSLREAARGGGAQARHESGGRSIRGRPGPRRRPQRCAQ